MTWLHPFRVGAGTQGRQGSCDHRDTQCSHRPARAPDLVHPTPNLCRANVIVRHDGNLQVQVSVSSYNAYALTSPLGGSAETI